MNAEHPGHLSWAEPYKIRMVELLRMSTREECEQAIREAGFNTFLPHMDVVAEAVADVYKRRNDIRGLTMIHEPEHLRFFQARFEPV